MRKSCAFLAAALLASACTEKLGSGRACPDLCPIETVGIADTTIQGVILDTAVVTGPEIGSEGRILLVSRTDNLVDLRGVIRFDTLPNTFIPTSSTNADTIRAVSHASLVVVGDSVASDLLPTEDITISAYDVDTSGVADTAVAPIVALFRPDRLLGQATFAGEAAGDTLVIPLNDSIVSARFTSNGRLRIGLRVQSSANATVRLSSTSGGNVPTLRYRASATADTAAADTAKRSWFPSSKTPTDDARARSLLADYTLVVKGTPEPPAGAFAVGGIPSRRTYLAFDVPKRLLDSTQIVRATLRLNQIAVTAAEPRDTARLEVLLGTSRAAVTDIAKRALFHEPIGVTLDGVLYGSLSGLREVRLRTDTSATRSIEIAPILRQWANVNAAEVPHSVILRLPLEGGEISQLWFSSLEAPLALRPSLQITFVPRNAPGIP